MLVIDDLAAKNARLHPSVRMLTFGMTLSKATALPPGNVWDASTWCHFRSST